METVWFVLIAFMLTVYAALDGFDFGAGILHNFVARTEEERQTVIAAIGPVWDGNEVWLLAGGGITFFAFPRAYAAGFSGFYLPLMMVLWLLIGRGLSIEFRSKERNPLWRSFWDGGFAFTSTLLAIIFGAALGNILRGVPLDASGYFSGPLFTNFRIGPHPGVLDWYTVLVGLLALAALAGHGANYLIAKTEGAVRDRSRAFARPLWAAVVVLGLLATFATAVVQPGIVRTVEARPLAWLFLLLVVAGLAGIFVALRDRRRDDRPFLASLVFLIGSAGATATGLYPNILVSTLDPTNTLNVTNASNSPLALGIGLIWWVLAIVLASGYFIYMFHAFRGKVRVEDGYGH